MQQCNIVLPNLFFLQGMTINIMFAFSVGDTTHVVYNKDWARQIKLVTPNTVVNVVILGCENIDKQATSHKSAPPY